nr:uncharacterized protein LOC115260022 [Aedes albopictus]
MEWVRHKRQQAAVDLSTFADFLSEIVSEATKATLYSDPRIDGRPNRDRKEKRSRSNEHEGFLNAHVGIEQSSINSVDHHKGNGPHINRKPCRGCNSLDHRTRVCEDFRRLVWGDKHQHSKHSNLKVRFRTILGSEDDCGDASRRTQQKDAGKKSCEDLKFVELLVTHGKVLLEKSQAPPVKDKKKDAGKEICVQMFVQHGVDMTPKQVMKKINNMKARIKAKTDRKQTGNRKILLTEAERKFFDLMGGIENPSITKRTYGVAIGSSAGSSRATFNEPTEERSVRGGGREEDIPLDESRDHGRNNSTVKEVELNEKTTQFSQQTRSYSEHHPKNDLEEQLKLIQAQQAYTARLQAQQDERHEKEMELLVLKKKLTLLKIQQFENEEH